MKKINLIVALFLAGSFTSAYSVSRAQPQDADPVQNDVQKIRQILSEHVDKQKDIINYSTDKDVVLLVGNTGSGKSSLAAYLSGIPLMFDEADEIISLQNPNNEKIAIGDGLDSVTSLPVPVPIANTDLIVYDLPGLLDSRGVPYDVLTAAFLKNIAENARNVRFVFVESCGSIIEGARGRLFKELLNKARNVFDVNASNSMFVVTKTPHAMSDHKKNQINSLMHDMFGDQFVRDNGNHFVERKKGIDPAEKEHLIQAMCQLNGTHYDKENRPLDVSALYSADAQSRLQLIFDDVKTKAFQVLKDNPDFNSSRAASDYIKKELEEIGNAPPKMFNDFQKKINDSLEVQLLKNLARIDIEQWVVEATSKIQVKKQDADKAYKLLKNKEDAEEQRRQAQKAREAAENDATYHRQLYYQSQQEKKELEKAIKTQKDQQVKEQQEKAQKEKEQRLKNPRNWPQQKRETKKTEVIDGRPYWKGAVETVSAHIFRRSRWYQVAVTDIERHTFLLVETIATHPETGEERVLERKRKNHQVQRIGERKTRSRSCSRDSTYAANSTHGL
jgi:energy-coupling factor transporter ATP-binding protein EcfA2/DNA-directed RNA polymerase subunit M/transcription elongation factor TFIIS